MAQRITTAVLQDRLVAVRRAFNMEIGCAMPLHDDYRAPWTAGCMYLQHHAGGYQLCLTSQDGCSGHVGISGVLSAREMLCFLEGILAVAYVQQIGFRVARERDEARHAAA